ncbi:MAG: hypothetical protein NXI07_09620, partial [bacterium]|nr:hypothetical protein [bacterium]
GDERGEQREAEATGDRADAEQRERASDQGSHGETQQEQPRSSGQDQSLDERLRQMERRQRQSERQREQAERLREQADRLINRDPAEQEGQDTQPRSQQQTPPQMGEGAGDGERDPDAPPAGSDRTSSDFVPVDARDQENSSQGQPVGEWYGPDGEPVDPGTSQQAAQRLRRASQEAQKALEEQQVPRRYRHLVREVFQRVQDRADQIEGGGSIAPQGQDAVPTKPEGKETSSDG